MSAQQGSTRSGPSRGLALLLTAIMLSLMVPFTASATVSDPDIAGIVRTDPAGPEGLQAPIQDVKVTLYKYIAEDDGGGYWYEYKTTMSDSLGQYDFRDLPERTYALGYSHDDYRSEFAYNSATLAGATSFLVDGSGLVTVDEDLTPSFVSISGSVTDVDPPNSTLPDIDVTLYPANSDNAVASTMTDGSGDYAFRDIAAGTYDILFEDNKASDGYYESELAEDEVLASPIVVNQQMTLELPDIAGAVIDEANPAPLENIMVKLYRDGDIAPSDYIYTYTNENGVYGFYDVAPGSYVVKFYDTDYSDGAYQYEYYDNSGSYDGADRLAFDGASKLTTINAELAPMARAIEGMVRAEEATAGLEGMKVRLYKWYTSTADAKVMPHTTSGWTEIQSTYTNDSGGYAFYGLSARDYRVGVEDKSGEYLSEFFNDSLTVEGGNNVNYNGTDTRSGIDFELATAPEEVWDYDRYTTAIDIAREAFPGWEGIDTVIIASGDDRAAADPLAAAGLCWANDAPLFLVSKSGPPHAVKEAIIEIIKVNGPVEMIVVGGPVSVPDWVADLMEDYIEGKFGGDDVITGPGGTWRRVEGDDRYELAAKIVDEMAASGKTMSDNALIANGADSSKFFDALALSPIARHEGAPVLLVSKDQVPYATSGAIVKHGISNLWIAGGDMSVGPKAKARLAKLATIRKVWAGNDRYQTARLVAEGALSQGWLSNEAVGIAAKLPDALTGGSVVGQRNGVLLLAETNRLPTATGIYLSNNRDSIKECYIFGGPKSVGEATRDAVDEKLW